MVKKVLTKPATIYDVADKAGVSHITVSRVVNEKGSVSEKTRKKVLRAMQELGYVQNPIAQALQTRRTRTIEIISTDVWGLSPEITGTILWHAEHHNYKISLTIADPDEIQDMLIAIPNRMVAGTLFYGEDVTMDYAAIRELVGHVPFVQIAGMLHTGLPSITYDQHYATRIAMQHLIDLGHRRIAHLGGQQRLIDGLFRYEAYQAALQANGLPLGPVAMGDFSIESGAATMQQIISSGERFTAVFAASDAMAIGAIHVLREQGLSVPEDVSVVGFDDERILPYIQPPLTTVNRNFRMIGQMALEYLLELINNPETLRHQRIIPLNLIIRKSTCPPNA
jgi:LacI family transcriptional regulator